MQTCASMSFKYIYNRRRLVIVLVKSWHPASAPSAVASLEHRLGRLWSSLLVWWPCRSHQKPPAALLIAQQRAALFAHCWSREQSHNPLPAGRCSVFPLQRHRELWRLTASSCNATEKRSFLVFSTCMCRRINMAWGKQSIGVAYYSNFSTDILDIQSTYCSE